ncbi:hypothetical protein PAGU2595_016770 [Lysobacter xanthus]
MRAGGIARMLLREGEDRQGEGDEARSPLLDTTGFHQMEPQIGKCVDSMVRRQATASPPERIRGTGRDG